MRLRIPRELMTMKTLMNFPSTAITTTTSTTTASYQSLKEQMTCDMRPTRHPPSHIPSISSNQSPRVLPSRPFFLNASIVRSITNCQRCHADSQCCPKIGNWGGNTMNGDPSNMELLSLESLILLSENCE